MLPSQDEICAMELLMYLISYMRIYLEGKGKGKAIPLQAWIGPEDPRRLRPPDFKTIYSEGKVKIR